MYLLFDIGGTKMRVAFSENGRVFATPLVVRNHQKFSEGMAVFKKVKIGLKSKKISALSGGVPGPLDSKKSMILNAPHLSNWNRKPFKKELQKIFKAPVYLENDAAMAGLGEAVFGAGKGKNIVAYITVSTGVNGVRIINGGIDKNSFGFEIGQQIINFGSASSPKYLEELISGSSLEKKYHKRPSEIGKGLLKDHLAKYLAAGINNTIVYWSPDVVVLGGSLVRLDVIDFEESRYYLKKLVRIFPAIPPVRKASLGDEGGLYGALVFARQKTGKRRI